MKCLLIMTFIFINGIENAEHKGRQSGTILREDDLDSKAKAWLLMVESGKADDEHVRKITPKSIFIAPLLTSRSNKCKEGYRHDHLGSCVKVIKLDHKAQLEMLLKRLSAMYAEKKPEEESLGQISSGPLHFSLPISGADSTTNDSLEETNSSTVAESTTTESATEDYEYSGAGNETVIEEGSGFEGSGTDEPCCNGTETATLISDEIEDTTTEVTTTEVPYTTENYETETYQPKDVLPVENETAAEEEPSESRIVFPDSLETSKRTASQEDAYQSWQGPYDVRKLPQQQFWWLPPNWRIDEEQRKPAVFKFWSHLPLVHDSSFIPDAHRRFLPPQHHDQFHQPPTRTPDGYSIELQQPLSTPRRGRIYTGRRPHSDLIQPRSYHVVRD
ncbi:UNVERIFIED_CONTAM: hypothetical protein PYX00_001017 [Menopon gallinae]|uniref:Uncharacterized protein n=1 Tax=Menopon gallinae TaxID=328185 RepID=A0AAW2ICN9_9NEOP